MANVSSSNGLEKRPKLRFPGFDEPWSVYKAEELFKNVADKNHPTETVLTIIQGKGTLPREQAGRNIHYDDSSLANYKKVKQGDFIIHLRSFEGGLEMANEDGIVSPAYTILRCKKPHSSLFYEAYFHTDEFINHILSKSVEGIRDGRQISYEAFKWLGLPYCDASEQEKIAQLFCTLGQRIEKQQQMVDALKKYKRGVTRAIFSKELSFSSEKSQYPQWDQKLIGEICKIQTGKSNTQDETDEGLYPFYVRSPVVRKSYRYLFDCEAVLTVGDGVGTGKVFHYVTGKFDLHQRVYAMTDFREVSGKYFYYFFSYFFYDRVMRMTAKTSVDSVRYEMIDKMPILIPCEEEQNQIVFFLDCLEAQLKDAEKELLLLDTLKSGLLQRLFI